MNVTDIPQPKEFDTLEIYPDFDISESADEPSIVGHLSEPFVLVMYTEESAEAEGFLIAPPHIRYFPSFELEDVTPGGALRVAVAWAREQDVRYILRYYCGRKNIESALKLFDTHDYK
jgi:hypothetical protein